ncbi:MAG: hypothetical protein RB191_11095 [Terriglobia bacterium]|nr:hypothetical protein [Terriglobia bacterium]
MAAEALGSDFSTAKKRAVELNDLADEVRNGAGDETSGLRPGSIARLFSEYQRSHEWGILKARTRKDYTYYLAKIEMEFGHISARAMTARVIKAYYRRLIDERGTTWAYHVIGTFRAALSWAVTEDWIDRNPALDVRVRGPKKRKVMWLPDQAPIYVSKAHELGWHSVAAMVMVFDCIGQSPVDVIGMRARAYDGRSLAVTREKTGVSDAPIPLWPEVIAELDTYLGTRPKLHPDAPLFVHEKTGNQWVVSTLAKVHSIIRTAAALPKELQLQDFRRTAQTEAGAAGATADELRALARHSTRSAALHYVHPDSRYVDSAQAKRRAARNKRTLSVPEKLE